MLKKGNREMKKTILIVLALCGMMMSSCGFLDKDPEQRASINSLAQVKKLLTTGYSSADIAFIGEFSSDNIVDNNSEDGSWTRYKRDVVKGVVENEIFAWQRDRALSESSGDGDMPISIWTYAYQAIGVANHALETIEELESNGSKEDFSGAKAEAYLIRAYHHFVLANIFCMPYSDDSKNQEYLGVPYVTTPEKTVYTSGERGTLKQLYDRIEEDLLMGLKTVSDQYDQPKYHFNKQAAYAFAARFYLYKRDYDNVIRYATLALGSNPMSYMRTEYWSKAYNTSESLLNAYSKPASPSNFLLMTTNSSFMRTLCSRYACNRQAAEATIDGQGPTWQSYSYHPCFQKIQGLYLRGDQEYGLFWLHTGEYFEYTDKVAGIGYVHNVNAVFTGEETLLCRAEAYIWKEDYANALADLKVWDDSRKIGLTTEVLPDLTANLIESFYNADVSRNGTALGRVNTLNCDKIDPSWVIKTDKQRRWLNCVLHFRRLETIHEGMRWQDIKRYGIEVRHKQGFTEMILPWDDLRRAVQIPATVQSAGMQPNPVPTTAIATSGAATVFKGSCELPKETEEDIDVTE